MNSICRVKVYSPSTPRTVAESAAVFQGFLTEVVYPFAKTSGIGQIWHFFEPYAEITWVDSEGNGQKFRNLLVENAPRYGMSVEKLIFDQTGGLADWFCTNDTEREFGAEVHALCARFYQAYQERKPSIDGGKGLRAQDGEFFVDFGSRETIKVACQTPQVLPDSSHE